MSKIAHLLTVTPPDRHNWVELVFDTRLPGPLLLGEAQMTKEPPVEINHVAFDKKAHRRGWLDRSSVLAMTRVKRGEMKPFAIAYHAHHLLALAVHDLKSTVEALRALDCHPDTRATDWAPLTAGEQLQLVERCRMMVLSHGADAPKALAGMARLYPDACWKDPLVMVALEAGICAGQRVTFRTNFGVGPVTTTEVTFVGTHKGQPMFEYLDGNGMPRWAWFSQKVRTGEPKGGA